MESYSLKTIVIRYAPQILFDMSKNSGQITKPVTNLFQDKNFAFVSTLMNDGSPQITPTWTDIEEEFYTELTLLRSTTLVNLVPFRRHPYGLAN